MKPEINLPRVYSGKISLGKTMFPRANVRSVTSTIVNQSRIISKQSDTLVAHLTSPHMERESDRKELQKCNVQ